MSKTAILSAILLILIVLLASACSEEDTGSIMGIIIGGREIPASLGGYYGGPISGVTVFIPETPHIDITNEEGRYTMMGVPPGTYTLRVKLLYLTLTETTVKVKSKRCTLVPNLEVTIPAFFTGGWGSVGLYDPETDEYIGDVDVHMGPDPAIRRKVRGELYSVGDDSMYLDETISLAIRVNDGEFMPLELGKNLFSYELDMILLFGKNTIDIQATNCDGGTHTQTLTIYYYPSGLVVSLKWEGEGDMDLHLIGPGGTICSYRNVNPDWGIAEYEEDDPVFHKDRRAGWKCGGETIALPNPSEGGYTVNVLYYGCGYPSLRNEPIRPNVTIYLDGDVYKFTSEKLMRVDDKWRVTSFILPGGKPGVPSVNASIRAQ